MSPEPYTQEDGDVVIYLFEDITPESSNRVIGEILAHEGKQIQLKVKCGGGTFDDSMALVDVVNEQNVQVNVVGYAYSGGFLVFCGATIRTMTPNSRLMYHDMAYQAAQKLEGHRQTLIEMEKLSTRYHKVFTDCSKIKKKTLEQYDSKQQDWFISYNEALKLGLLTHILNKETVTIPKQKIEMEAVTEIVSEYMSYEDYTKKVKEDARLLEKATTTKKDKKNS